MKELVDQFGWYMAGYTGEVGITPGNSVLDRLGKECPASSRSDGSGRLKKWLHGRKT